MLAKWQHAFWPCEFIVNLLNDPLAMAVSPMNQSPPLLQENAWAEHGRAMIRHTKSSDIAQIHWFVIIFCFVDKPMQRCCGFQRLVLWAFHKQLDNKQFWRQQQSCQTGFSHALVRLASKLLLWPALSTRQLLHGPKTPEKPFIYLLIFVEQLTFDHWPVTVVETSKHGWGEVVGVVRHSNHVQESLLLVIW